MILSIEQLNELRSTACERMYKEMILHNRINELDDYLDKIGMKSLIQTSDTQSMYNSFSEGKILIIGGTRLKAHHIYRCFNEFGIDERRVELWLGYNEAVSRDYNKLRHNPIYRLVLFGPLPHSVNGKEDSSSIIRYFETSQGFPKTIRLKDNNGLALTLTTLRNTISEQIDSGYIKV